MIAPVIYVRVKQLSRILNDLGFVRFLFIMAVVASVSYGAFMGTAYDDGCMIILALTITSIYFIQINRGDPSFLKAHVVNYKVVQLIEYLSISLPVIAGLVFHHQWTELLIFFFLVYVVVLFVKPLKKRALNTFIQRSVFDSAYEWKGGLRKSFYWFIFIVITSLVTSSWPGSIPIGIILTGLIVLGYTETNEPLTYLLSFEKPPVSFLLNKMKLQVILYSVTTMPLIIIYVILNTGLWYLAVIPYLLITIVQAYSIVCKYTFLMFLHPDQVDNYLICLDLSVLYYLFCFR